MHLGEDTNIKVREEGTLVQIKFDSGHGLCTPISLDVRTGGEITAPCFNYTLEREPCFDCPMVQSIEAAFNEIMRRYRWRRIKKVRTQRKRKHRRWRERPAKKRMR